MSDKLLYLLPIPDTEFGSVFPVRKTKLPIARVAHLRHFAAENPFLKRTTMQRKWISIVGFAIALAGCEMASQGEGSFSDGRRIVPTVVTRSDRHNELTLDLGGHTTCRGTYNSDRKVFRYAIPISCSNGIRGKADLTLSPNRHNLVGNFMLANGVHGGFSVAWAEQAVSTRTKPLTDDEIAREALLSCRVGNLERNTALAYNYWANGWSKEKARSVLSQGRQYPAGSIGAMELRLAIKYGYTSSSVRSAVLGALGECSETTKKAISERKAAALDGAG